MALSCPMNCMNNILNISKKDGFILFDCDRGVSSMVFKKGRYIYKINNRNSLARAKSDYKEYRSICQEFPDKIEKSSFFQCCYKNKKYTCVKQRIIIGKTLKEVNKRDVVSFLKNNPRDILFLKTIINEFFDRIREKKLYPDLVGNPSNQALLNSINVIFSLKRGLVVCDVGLSPHEDTLLRYGEGFYASENVGNYVKKMKKALLFLEKINK